MKERQWLTGEIDGEQLRASAMATDSCARWYGFKGILKSMEI